MRTGIHDAFSRWGWWFVPLSLVLGAGIAWFALDPGFHGAGSNATTAMASDAFEQRVRDYLLKNPEVIMEAVLLSYRHELNVVGGSVVIAFGLFMLDSAWLGLAGCSVKCACILPLQAAGRFPPMCWALPSPSDGRRASAQYWAPC
jgi:hypothetical protein